MGNGGCYLYKQNAVNLSGVFNGVVTGSIIAGYR
jgi:hypothetical protein